MNLVLTVLQIVAPVFLLAAVGFAWIRQGFEYRIEFVTQLAMTLAVPCLIFVSLMKTKIDPAALTALTMSTLVAYAGITLAVLGLVAALGLDRRTYAAPLMFGNTGNLGLPLALFAFGDVGLSYAIIVFALMAIWSFTFGIWLVSGGGSIIKAVQEPMVAATILGALFMFMDWQTPPFLTNTLELIGQMAIPLMLITLGVAVARPNPVGIGKAMALSFVKLVMCAVIAWVVGRWFTLDPIAFGVLILQVATPVAVTSYLIAEKYGADSDAVAGLVVASTLLSVGCLPLILGLVL
ncbi:MAG: AEC family transporter [Paracoccaceae bacterium]